MAPKLVLSNPEKASLYDAATSPDANFSLVCEDLVIAQVSSVKAGVILLIKICYCFNLEYPVGLKNTLLYIQKYILNINDNCKTPQSLLKFLKTLEAC